MFRGVEPTIEDAELPEDPEEIGTRPQRELRLLEATAWRILHFATRIESRIRSRIAKEMKSDSKTVT